MRLTQLLTTIACGTLTVGAAAAVELDEKPDGSWISLSGTVVAPTADSFVLDYGEGTVTVEMDDWDSYGDAYGLMDGDEVTVYGRVDDDLFEALTIEAGSVYVEDLGTYFYASAADEEDYEIYVSATPIVLATGTIRGEVTSVDADEREFTLDSGARQITVEAEFLGYNPFDDLGYQKIAEGDRVSVSGAIDYDLFEGRVFEADTVITLDDASR